MSESKCQMAEWAGYTDFSSRMHCILYSIHGVKVRIQCQRVIFLSCPRLNIMLLLTIVPRWARDYLTKIKFPEMAADLHRFISTLG